MLVDVTSNKPGATAVRLVDPDPTVDTGYSLIAADWGNVAWETVFSGPRGTQGARAAGATPANRPVSLAFRIRGATKTQMLERVAALDELADELRRFGGRITWQSKNQTYRQHFEVLAGASATSVWQPAAEHANWIGKTLDAICGPYLLGDPLDILDEFASDTRANYTFDSGTSSDLAVTGGLLDAVANLTTEKRAVHTAYGYAYGDCQATIKATPGATISSFKAGVVLGRDDQDDYLEVYVDDNGTNSRLRLDLVQGGSRTNRSSTNLAARVANGTPFWVRGRIEGNVVFLEHFTSRPTPMGAPTTSASYTLTTAEAAQFGIGTTGKAGLVWIPQHTDATLDDLAIEPYTYRNVTLPDVLELQGEIPGEAPALTDVEITHSGGAAAPKFALIGWWERPRLANLLWNGDFEIGFSPVTWSVGAVTNIAAAASSRTVVADAGMFGANALEVVTPATVDSGVSTKIWRRFRRGVTYTAEVWVRAPSSTTQVKLRLGNSAANDKATSSAVALTAAKQLLTVTWTPSGDRDDAHVAVLVNAATATTFRIDSVKVYEGTAAPTGQNQLEGRGAFPALGIIEAENDIGAGTVASANFRSGEASTGNLEIAIDPSLLVSDDYSDEIAIEVWFRGEVSAGDTVVGCGASGLSTVSGTDVRYPDEWPDGLLTFVTPTATVRRFYRVGIIRFPTDQGRYDLAIGGDGATLVDIDYVILVPARGRACSPTGKSETGYPHYLADTDETRKRIRSDLSAYIDAPIDAAPGSAAHGLGGALLEFPPGRVDSLVKLSSLVPGDPTSGSATEQLSHAATVHYAVTPRYHLARA